MKFLLALVLTFAFVYFLRASIKKHAVAYYIGASVITLFTICTSANMLPVPIAIVMETFFWYGTMSTAMLSLVMYTNAFRNGAWIQKTFMPIRAELSIIACILTYGHNIFTGKTYFIMLFTKPEKMSLSVIYACVMTIVLIAMMTPLFITSFKCVRKKMKAKAWKKLQSMAYVFYMLIYVHIMCLMLPVACRGNTSYMLNVVVYSVVFLGYGTCRLHKYYKKSKKRIALVLTVAMSLVLFVAVALPFIASVSVESAQADATLNGTSGDEEEVQNTDTEQAPVEVSPYEIDLLAIADGDYTGTAEGFNGPVTVTVTMTGGVIEKITLDAHVDDPEYMGNATGLRKQMVEAQDIDVDIVAGATYSSNGIKDAVLDALTH